MKAKTKMRLAAWTLCILLLALMTPAALAIEPINPDKLGSVSVTLLERTNKKKVGGSFTLYAVALYDKTAKDYAFTPEFAGCGMKISELTGNGAANHLTAIARDKAKPVTGKTASADASGTVRFSDLKIGIYLLVQEGSVPGYYDASPFLVSVPMQNKDKSAWVYDIDASPKVETRPRPDDTPRSVRVSVLKKWAGDEPAEVEESARPKEITAVLLRNNVEYASVVLSEENGWMHSWYGLSESDAWTVVEKDVPDGYTVSYQNGGRTITMLNTKTPPPPPDNPPPPPDNPPPPPDFDIPEDDVPMGEVEPPPEEVVTTPPEEDFDIPEDDVPLTPTEIIQTGQLNWPIPVLAVAGLAVFGYGAVSYRKNRVKNHEED